MRKYFMAILGLLWIIPSSYSQIMTFAMEDFDGDTISYRSSTGWKIGTGYYTSYPNGYLGIVPNKPGDSIVLTSPVYNLKNYNYVHLRFNHICKISPRDIARIDYKIKNTNWQAVPSYAYMGKSVNYALSGCNASNYREWNADDSLALPGNLWWKQETFDLSGNVGGDDEVQFRFVIKKGITLGTQISYGWLLDDIEVVVSPFIMNAPVVDFIGYYPMDTVYSTGPYIINTKVKTQTNAPIENPLLIYTAVHTQGTYTDTLLMEHIAGDSLWKATIPQYVIGTQIAYTITGRDTTSNEASISSGYLIQRPNNNYGDNSVALTSINFPVKGLVVGDSLTPVTITLRNTGNAALRSATIYWSLNGVVKIHPWTGNLPLDFEQQVPLGTYLPRMEGNDTIRIWISMPNEMPDPNVKDDTLSVITYGCIGLAGHYTVGRNGQFPSVAKALEVFRLSCTPTGNITLQLEDDIYNENWAIASISDFMGNYHLTITSLSGNKDSVILRPLSGVGITLSNVHNLTIENITIDAASSGTYGIRFLSACTNVIVTHCSVFANMVAKTSLTAYAPVYKGNGSGVAKNISIINNVIRGGYYGIYFYGGTGTSAYATNIVIDSNTISNASNIGIYGSYTDFSSISCNNITGRAANTATSWCGIQLTYCNGDITRNHIIQQNPMITNSYGINVQYFNHNNTTDTSLITENEIVLYTTTYAGIYVNTCTKARILHNSIYVTGSGEGRGIQILSSPDNYLLIKNNNIIMESMDAYPIHLNEVTHLNLCDIDYNNMYAPTYAGFVVTGKRTIADWQETLATDRNSVAIRPGFKDSTLDLELSDYQQLYCIALPGTGRDITGQSRSGYYTSMGCYHSSLTYMTNVALSYNHDFQNSAAGTTDSIRVTLRNTGISTLSKVNLNWSVNDTIKLPLTWSGTLLPQESITLTLGKITYPVGMATIKTWIANLGTQQDEFSGDDTISITEYFHIPSPFSGTYTVGIGGTYPSISIIASGISRYGVNGDIILKFMPGTYDGTFLPNLFSDAGVHALTLTSATGNAEEVIINTGRIDAGHSKCIMIHAVTIQTLDSYAITISNTARKVEVRNSILSGASTHIYGVHDNNNYYALIDTLIFINNLVKEGSYGIYLSRNEIIKHYIIDSNIFLNQSSSAIYSYDEEISPMINSISYNTMISNSSSWKAISLDYTGVNAITANRIVASNGSYGIYSNSNNNIRVIANNEIILRGAGIQYGIYNGGMQIIHNSIYIQGTGASIGINTSIANNRIIKNNNIIMESATGYPIYSSSVSGTTYEVDYNNMYAPGYVGYAGSTKIKITDWQQTITTDKHSVSINPPFVDDAINLQVFYPSGLECPLLIDYPNDIDNNARLEATTMGCYQEGSNFMANGRLKSIVNRQPQYVGDIDTIQVEFINMGVAPLTGATIYWSFNGDTKIPITIAWTAKPLYAKESSLINLGTITYMDEGSFTIEASIANLGTMQDDFSEDDKAILTGYICSYPLSGTYTIGATGCYFSSITEAINRLRICRSSGDVIFQLQSGLYQEDINLEDISLYLDTNSLTFISATGNASGVIIETQSMGMQLSNSNNIRMENITIDARTNKTHGIYFSDTCSNIVIKNCRILGDTVGTTSATAYALIYKANNTGIINNISITNNILDGGYYGIYLYGGTGVSAYGKNIIIDSNIIMNTCTTAIYGYYTDFESISYNRITSRRATTNITASWFGIYLYYSNGKVIGNRIRQQNTAITQPYGIYTQFFCYDNTTKDTSLIANNEIMLYTTGSYAGIYTNFYTKAKIIHNSIYISGSGASYGIRIVGHAGSYLVVKSNNIVMESVAAYPVYIDAITYLSNYDMDYNNMCAPTYVGYAGTAKTTLDTWRQTVTLDQHSISICPQFIDITAHLQLIDYNGLFVPEEKDMPYDIEQNLRIGTTAVGCYHGLSYSINGTLLNVIGNREGYLLGQTDTVKVILLNSGDTPLDTAVINWLFDGNSQVIPWAGLLQYGETDTITLGIITYSVGDYSVEAYIVNIGNQQDENSDDDTVRLSGYVCSPLSTNYTVGEAGDFKTISEALSKTQACGTRDITLELLPGRYKEDVNLKDISAYMGSHTLTLTSSTNNASDVIIETQYAGIQLSNSNNLILKDITLDARTNKTYGINFLGVCTNVCITNCHILGDTVGTTLATAYASIYKANGTGIANDIIITNNTIDGGYYGIYFYGGTTSTYGTGIYIDSNIIINTSGAGVYGYYTGFNSISHNRLTSRTSNVAASWYGIQLTYCNGDVIGNRIIQQCTTITQPYGIWVQFLNYDKTTDTSLVANNEIMLYMASSNAGIYANTYTHAKIVHNSIYISGSSIAQGIQIAGSPYSRLVIRNNNIVMESSTAYPIHVDVTDYLNLCDIDYNNMYAPSYVGYAGTAKSTLTDWRQTVTSDQHSVSIFPPFMDNTISLAFRGISNLSCPLYSEINTDINAYLRANTTTMGAYNAVASFDLAIQSIVCEETEVLYNQTVPVKIKVINTGFNDHINNAVFGWSVNGIIQPSYSWVPSKLLTPQADMEIPIGSFIPIGNTNVFDIVTWIENVNGGKDSLTWNDTAEKSVTLLFTGNNLCLNSLEELVPDELSCSGDHTSIKLGVINAGTLDYDFALNPVKFNIQVTSPVLYSLDTVISSGEILSGKTAVIELTDLFPIIISGNYDIKIWIDSINDVIHDDTLLSCYISEKFGLPIDENFSFPNLPLSFKSEGNTANIWKAIPQGAGVDTVVIPQFGTGMLAFSGTPGSMSTLSTKQLDLSRAIQPTLSFWYFHDTIPCDDYTDVRITIDGGAIYTTLFSLTKYDAVYGWKEYSTDLPMFAINQCVVLVFEAMEKSRSGNVTQYIDRILVTAKQEIAITGILTSDLSVCDLQNKEWKVVLSNKTAPALDYSITPVAITLELVGTSYSFTDTIKTDKLEGFSSDTLTLPSGFDFTPREYIAKAYISSILGDIFMDTIAINPNFNIRIHNISNSGNPVQADIEIKQNVTIKNTGNILLPQIDLILSVDAKDISPAYHFTTTASTSDTLQPGDSIIITFNIPYTIPWSPEYHVHVVGYLSCDSASVNKEAIISEYVDIDNLALINVKKPAGQIDTIGTSVNIEIMLENKSDVTSFSNVKIHARIEDPKGNIIAGISEAIPKTIKALYTESYTFISPYPVPNVPEYYIIVFIEKQTKDNYQQDDTIRMKRTVAYIVDIESIETSTISMSQNFPNPANNSTSITYSIPANGEVLFTISSIDGQVLYNKTIKNKLFVQTIDINVSHLASGIYFYSMEFNGQRITKRMSIKR